MTVKPSTLKDEFNQLFQKHHALETDPGFISKKQKLKQLKLKPRHDLNTLSEIFQDPELVSRISQEAHEILRLSSTRAPRIRQEQDIIIHRKPQAKDVYRRTVIDDEVANMYNTVENSIRQEDEYINPIAPKQRKYLAHEKEWQLTPTEETIVPSTSPVEPAMNTMHESFPIALPSIPAATIDLDTNTSIEHNAELNNMFDTVAQQMSQSPLKTVGPKHLYTYLPRQCDSFAYNYVKEDFTPAEKHNQVNTPFEDTLITIIVHKSQRPSVKYQEIEILGRQPLTDIRDAVFCLSDFTNNRDKSSAKPDGEILNTPQKKTSPCMIYMDHVFYIDTRYTGHPLDLYPTWIESWLTKKKVNRQQFEYTTQPMQDTTLGNMSLILNKPIAFIHQGDCEHMILIPDVRLLAPNEYKSITEFPRTTHNFTYIRYKCSMCSVYPATKITMNDIVSGFSPCYFCDDCFASFHPNDGVVAIEYKGHPGGDHYRYQQQMAKKKQ